MNRVVHQRIKASARSSFRDGAWHLEFHAMATQCRVCFAAPSAAAAQAFQQIVLDWVAHFEERYSRFVPESLISHINDLAGKEWVDIDPETERLFALCHEAHFFTRGVFDPTALPLIRLWNWKANPPVIPEELAIETAKGKVGWSKVRRASGKIFLPEEGMCIDLGGIGKEYAVDQVAALAVQQGINSVLVDFGQDIYAHGKPADGRPVWFIGLEDPQHPGQCWTGLAVQNLAVATSGDYVRRFDLNGRRYGHILDIRTGYPVANGCRAVSVIAPRCTVAGLLSTTVFVLGPEEGLRLIEAAPGVEGCILMERSRICSRRFYEHVVS